MVNAKRVESKLPCLLVNGSTTKKKSWNSLMRNRYRLGKFKKDNPEKFNVLMNKTMDNFNEWEKAISS